MTIYFVSKFLFSLLILQRGNPLSMLPSKGDYPHWSSGKMVGIGHPICAQKLEDKSADCYSRHLTEVPQDLYPDIQKLNLWKNNLTVLRNLSFQRYVYLVKIDLASTNMHYIESGTFYPLKYLKELILSQNHALHLHKDIFRWSYALLNLKLADCRLKSFDFGAMEFLIKLEKLDLSSNEITFINAQSCGKNKHLYIDLSSNNISKLTPENFAMDNLATELVLLKNPIQLVDPDTIVSLHVNGLSVGEYPLSNKVLKNLTLGVSRAVIEKLTISTAGIRRIPPDLFEPLHNKSLAYLSLAGNKLILYPFVFANLTLLSKLDLWMCDLQTLDPEYFNGMTRLHSIMTFFNYFRYVNPSNTTWNVNLHELTISMSYCEEITQYTFKGLNNLTKLSLYFDEGIHSKIATIELVRLKELTLVTYPFNTVILKTPLLNVFKSRMSEKRFAHYLTFYEFQHSPLIEFLYLDHGGLGVISGQFLKLDFISCLQRLHLLDLSFNYIRKLSSQVFNNLSSLQSLYINNNEIKTISSDAFAGLIILKVLDLNSNEIFILPDNFLKNMKALTNVYLDLNALSYLNEDLFGATHMLTILTLANNRLVGFNQSTFDPIYSTLKSVDISGNVLVCNCDSKWLVKKLSGYLVNKDKTLCSTSSGTLEPLRGKPIGMFQPSKYCGMNIVLYSSIISAVLTVSAISVICYHHRWLLRYKLFLLKLAILGYREIHDARDREDFEYDINVMFMDDDKEWAEENLRPALGERLPNHERIAFGDDELMLGMHYFDAIYYNVEKSFKTVLLLSREAVHDHIFMTKFRIAMNHVTDTETENLILVFLEGIPDEELPYLVRLYLSGHGANLSWEEDDEGQEYFWNKLTKHFNVNLRVNHMIPPD